MASSQTKFYGALVAILLVGAALIGYATTRGDDAVAEGPLDAGLADLESGELVPLDVGVATGPEDAPVLIEEYGDYLCGACGMVASLTVPQVLERYVDTGKARFVFVDFPVHPGDKAVLGAEAARCAADQDAFWPMHKALMSRQREWGARRDPVGQFRDYAEALGLAGDALVECVESHKHRQAVMAGQTRARQLGLGSTPTFIINGRRFAGAMGIDQMAAIIEEELAKQ